MYDVISGAGVVVLVDAVDTSRLQLVLLGIAIGLGDLDLAVHDDLGSFRQTKKGKVKQRHAHNRQKYIHVSSPPNCKSTNWVTPRS